MEGLDTILTGLNVTHFCVCTNYQARNWISNVICHVSLLCSMIWGERQLFILLILVELLTSIHEFYFYIFNNYFLFMPMHMQICLRIQNEWWKLFHLLCLHDFGFNFIYWLTLKILRTYNWMLPGYTSSKTMVEMPIWNICRNI